MTTHTQLQKGTRVRIRDTGGMGTVVEAGDTFALVCADCDPDFVALLTVDDICEPGQRIQPRYHRRRRLAVPAAILWPVGVIATIVAGFATWMALSRIPVAMEAVVVVAVFAGAATYFGWRAWRC